ncbi:MAG: HD domain-containing protein [Magnetococcus sp. DMHC-6]
MDLAQQIAELEKLSYERLGEQAAKKISEAIALACLMHEGQFRKLDATPYVSHCLSVALNCLSWGLVDPPAIMAALLHDAIEDAPEELNPSERIAQLDPEVLSIVLALSKIRNLQTGTGDLPATYRRILQAASKDLRVLVVKIFDVLHNSETLHVHGPAKAKTKASIGLIYVGVARRLGMMALAEALIDYLLPNLMPVQIKRAQKVLLTLQEQGKESMERLVRNMKLILEEGLAQDFILEPKKIADYFLLAEQPGTGRLRLVGWPVFRLKLFVEDDDAAWHALGKMHGLFGPLPRHIRDYLNAPRVNGFRALSTRVFWEGQPLTVQVVRTRDEAANRMGILAKWGVSGPDPARYMRLLATLGDSDLRMSEVHAHVLPDLLDVYTPKGDRLTFPIDSVVVDFAYLVHTDLGHRCVGARVNGVPHPPDFILSDGDVVDIMTSKEARPQRAWLDVVKTARARTLIKEALREQDIGVQGVRRNLKGHFTLISLVVPDIFWSPCCLAVPEDPIRGRLSADGRWIVHHAECANAKGGHWEIGSWAINNQEPKLKVTFNIRHQSGALLSVLELLGQLDVNGHSIESKGKSGDIFSISMVMGGQPISTMGKLLKQMAKIEAVQDILSYSWLD